MMSSESESTAANSNNDEQQQIKMTRMAEWLKKADAVCFDVDSTVINTEGIDELADYFGAGEAVAKLTKEAMEGGMKFEEALDARLKLINPTQQGVDKFMALHAFPIMPGMRELVVKLLTSGKQVFLVSGGFRQMIAPVANEIGVPVNKIYANNIMFDEEGNYAGFDDTEPTSRSGGKAEAVKRIKASNGFQTVVMVGDGMTDLEARVEGGADAFICFTGVVRRDAVAEGADLAVGEMAQIMDLLL